MMLLFNFDGDGQHSAKYIDLLVKEIENGNSIVIGSRFVDEKKAIYSKNDWKSFDCRGLLN